MTTLLFVVLLLLLVSPILPAAPREMVLDRFGPTVDEGIPPGWELLSLRKVRRATRYSVVREGHDYSLRAESDASASALYKRLDLDPRAYPTLSWRWRVEGVVERGDARRRDGDDAAARVLVGFEAKGGGLWKAARDLALRLTGHSPPDRVVVYVWDNRLPPGTQIRNAHSDRARMLVVESGPRRAGRWVTEQRNVFEDYRLLFGEEPERLWGAALMTDTDDTGSRAVAYYDDIVLRSAN